MFQMVTKVERKRTAREKEKRRSRRTNAFAFLGVVAGLISTGYFVLVSAPSLWVLAGGVLLCLAFTLLAVIEYFESQRGRLAFILIFIAVFAIVSCEVWRLWEARMNEQATDGLSISISIPASGTVMDSLVSVINNGPVTLSKPTILCHFNRMTMGGIEVFHNVGTEVIRSIKELYPGGDAESQGCLINWNSHPIIPLPNSDISCADIEVDVSYIAETSPRLKGEKKLRFVYGYAGEKTWVPQPLKSNDAYCSC